MATWKVYALFAAGVFVAGLLVVLAVARLHGAQADWLPTVALAAATAAAATLRFRGSANKEFGRLRRRNEAAAEAMRELVETMARASASDLSVFVSAHQCSREPDSGAAFMTSRGSLNHHVLVQMTDLGLARPREMRPVTADFAIVEYELTPSGLASLGAILELVAERRRYFAASV